MKNSHVVINSVALIMVAALIGVGCTQEKPKTVVGNAKGLQQTTDAVSGPMVPLPPPTPTASPAAKTPDKKQSPKMSPAMAPKK